MEVVAVEFSLLFLDFPEDLDRSVTNERCSVLLEEDESFSNRVDLKMTELLLFMTASTTAVA
jgi:hypothetical protein